MSSKPRKATGVSTGARYTTDFTPAKSFALDADTRALFRFDRSFDGVSGGGVGWIPGTVLAKTSRVDRRLDVGGRTVRVKPFLGDLEWTEGALPTAQGVVRVRHERRPDGSIDTKIDAPPGVKTLDGGR